MKADDPDWTGLRISHADFARELAARRAALGDPQVPRNDGTRRTDSKRALLAAIAAAGGRW
ncbi:hypothetical protein [Sphingomonas sp. VNH70]|uniref:hypothetical protein n=1 Tax=Sphingomonas silueang TaxID=3156617 RepID=UPI0032B575CC